MASIFLSYDREDEPRARPVAALLERSGHSVWWDRQIRGGGEFSAEIEAALDAAEKIVVLWSARAVKSAWVRDEAAVGRDTGRLVPATLDGTPPPLGFRQFQTIDLSKTKWRGRSPQLEQLVDAVATADRTEESARPRPRKEVRPIGRPLLLGLCAILVLAMTFAAAVWLWRSAGAPDRPQIAIRPADETHLSRQVVHDLVLRVPDLPGADASAYDLVDAAQKSSKAELALTVGAASGGGRERRDLVLRASDSAIMWSSSIDLPAAASANLPQQLAVQAQRALSCAAEVLSYRRETIRTDTFKLYLSACTTFDNASGTTDTSQQRKLFEQVLAQAPHFEAAWAKLLILEVNDIYGADDRRTLLRKIEAQIAQAQKLGLDFGELYMARAIMPNPTEFLERFRIYEEGARRHPGSAALFRAWGQQFWYVGEMNNAVGLSARAVQLDPLSPANQQSLIIAYAYAGNIDAAYAQLRKAEQLWPGSLAITDARYGLALRYGDPKEALELLRGPIEMTGLQAQQMAFLRARIDPSPANIERSIAEDRKVYDRAPNYFSQIVQTLAEFGRNDEVLDILINYGGGPVAGLESGVLFRPAFRDVWRDPRSMAAAARLGLLYYWKASGNWPDFCADPSLPYNCKKEAAKYRVQKLTVAPAKK
jgi:tetratricopeptide (TPR) repeat protein